MDVYVKAQGHDIPISVDPGQSVGAAKALLGEKLGLSPTHLQLIFQGSTLGDDASLASCNVESGETLQLAIARRGGGAPSMPGAELSEGTELALATMEDDPLDPNSLSKKNVTSVLLETNDGQVFDIESRVAFVSPAVCRGFDPTKPEEPVLLPNVSAHALNGILEYCQFHTAPGRSAKESRAFDKKFARVDRATMCELASAAYYMELEPLIDLTCKAIASSIDWSSPEAIRDAFGLPDDLTEEEKLEPIACDADDLRTRQYNNLLARKRKQLAESKAGKPSAEEPQEDTRSIEELMAFLGEDAKPEPKPDKVPVDAGKKKKKKKNKKKRNKGRDEEGDEEDDQKGDDDTGEYPADEHAEGDPADDPAANKELDEDGEFGEAKREELKKKLLANEMTPEEMDALFGNFEDDDEMDEEQEQELAMFSARLGLGKQSPKS